MTLAGAYLVFDLVLGGLPGGHDQEVREEEQVVFLWLALLLVADLRATSAMQAPPRGTDTRGVGDRE